MTVAKRIDMRVVKRMLQIGFLLAIFYLLGRLVVANWDEFRNVFYIGWRSLLLLFACLLGVFFSASARFANIYRAIGAQVGYLESFGLYMASGVINFVLPAQSGSAARAIYLKDRYGMPYSQAPSVILGGLVITFFAGGMIMMGANIGYLVAGQPPPGILWMVSLIFIASLISLWVRIPQRITARFGRIGNMLDLFFEGIERLRAHRREFIEAGLWQVAEFAFSGLGFWVAFNSLGVATFTILAGLNFSVFASLLNTVFITPGNIGVLEAAIGYISQIYNFTFIQGVSATALVHGGGYLVYFVLAPVSWYFLYRDNKAIDGD